MKKKLYAHQRKLKYMRHKTYGPLCNQPKTNTLGSIAINGTRFAFHFIGIREKKKKTFREKTFGKKNLVEGGFSHTQFVPNKTFSSTKIEKKSFFTTKRKNIRE